MKKVTEKTTLFQEVCNMSRWWSSVYVIIHIVLCTIFCVEIFRVYIHFKKNSELQM